jgi:hypothetical protein
MGIDAWGWDRPLVMEAEDARRQQRLWRWLWLGGPLGGDRGELPAAEAQLVGALPPALAQLVGVGVGLGGAGGQRGDLGGAGTVVADLGELGEDVGPPA